MAQLNSKLTDNIIVRYFISESKRIEANSVASFNINTQSITGYKPLIALYGSNNMTSAIFPYKTATNLTDTEPVLSVRNTTTNAINDVNISAYILYIK